MWYLFIRKIWFTFLRNRESKKNKKTKQKSSAAASGTSRCYAICLVAFPCSAKAYFVGEKILNKTENYFVNCLPTISIQFNCSLCDFFCFLGFFFWKIFFYFHFISLAVYSLGYGSSVFRHALFSSSLSSSSSSSLFQMW